MVMDELRSELRDEILSSTFVHAVDVIPVNETIESPRRKLNNWKDVFEYNYFKVFWHEYRVFNL